MAYVLPQVLVYQEFQQQTTALARPLVACIVGPNYALNRYSVSGEKTLIKVTDSYDYTQEVCYLWPNRVAGGVVDQSYTKVYVDDALLLYFHDPIGSGSDVKAVSDRTNRVRAETLVFKTANDVDRSAAFLRDVQVGDAIRLFASPWGEVVEYESYVTGFVAEVVAATVDTASADTTNQAVSTASTSQTKTGGSDNSVVVDSLDGTLYDGLADDAVAEQYTVEVISGSTGGDATTAILRVTSASGLDNVASLVPDDFGSPTAIGTRGLTATFINNETGSSTTPGVDPDDFLVGQTWLITVAQDFTPVTETSGGDYTGTEDTTYIVEVTKGGVWADTPQVSVSTTTGVDISGPTDVEDDTFLSIGTKGTLIKFAGDGLCLGDRYYVVVTAEAEGAIRTLILANNLPSEFLGWYHKGEPEESSTSVLPELDLKLFIKKNMEVSKNRTGYAPVVNWSQSATEVCLNSGIIGYDSTWVSGGVEQPLELYDGEVYVEHRDLLTADCGVVSTVTDASLVDEALGTVHPDNPLAFGVYKALQNSSGVEVRYVAICGTTFDEWNDALEVLVGRDDIYSLVPLTQDVAVLQAFASHCLAESTETNGRWRIAWGSLVGSQVKAVYTTYTNLTPLLATIEDDPDTTGTQYTLVSVVNGQLITNGVKAGDTLRAGYVGDGFGEYTYSEYIIDAVISEESCRLLTGPAAPVTVPSKVEFHRTLTNTELADELSLKPGLFSTRRFYLVWPDVVGNAGEEFSAAFLCSGLAGLRSASLPHQGLTNVELIGFDDVSRSVELFSATQLNTLAESGWWIVTQDNETGAIFNRHQLSTDMTDLNSREQNITTNLDSISYVFLDTLKEYIGKGNVTQVMLDILRTECQNILDTYINTITVDRLGSQILAGEISKLEIHPTLRDRVVINMLLDLPEPLNNIELHLIV